MKYSHVITGLVPLCAAALSFVGCNADEVGGGGTTGGAPAAGQTSHGGSAGTSNNGGSGGSVANGGTGGTNGGTGGTNGGTGGSTGGTGGTNGGSSGSGGTTGGGGGTGGSSAGMPAGGAAGSPAGGTGMGGMAGRGAGGMGAGGMSGGRGGMGAAGAAGSAMAGSGGSGGTGTCGTGTAKPCAPTGDNSIAYIGCSMAENIGNGYKAIGGKIMWTSEGYGTGAQCVPQWVEGGSAWPSFDKKLTAIGGKDKVKAIMVQICIISPATDDQVKSMIKAARAKVNADAHIYLVGQPQYANGHHCDIAMGQEATTETQAKKLGDDKSIDSNMSYLGTFMLDCDNGECADSCHANSKGEQSLGNQAKAFWGG
jgi:hypothetical protein